MPCRSDYQDPNDRERESQLVCQLLFYLLPKVNKPLPDYVKYAVASGYGNEQTLDQDTALLCETCQNLTKKQQDQCLYNGRDANARRLADWWEAHQEADKQREKSEKQQKAEEKLRAKALSKLTLAERQALGY